MAAPRATFLVVGGLFGLFFALATPPHDPPDEARHHARLADQRRAARCGRRGARARGEHPARHHVEAGAWAGGAPTLLRVPVSSGLFEPDPPAAVTNVPGLDI